MKTAPRQFIVTETEELSRAIDAAATLWPSDRKALVLHIIDEGIATLNLNAGSKNSIWPPNWREQLRDEWPE
jgi:hypothetical protein